MSLGITASVFGIGTALYGAYSASEAADAQAAAIKSSTADQLAAQEASTAAQMQIAEDQLSFDRQQWETQMQEVDDLEAIFGPVRENLATHYASISPSMYQMQSKENIEGQYERTNENIDKIFSNNGMYKSGQAVNAKVVLEAEREVNLANSQQAAQSQYNQEQSNWLNSGLNEKAQAQGQANQYSNQMNQAYGNQMNIQGQAGQNQMNIYGQEGQSMSNIYGQQAQGYNQMASGGFQLAGYAAGGGFGTNTSMDSNLMSGSNRTAQTNPYSFGM